MMDVASSPFFQPCRPNRLSMASERGVEGKAWIRRRHLECCAAFFARRRKMFRFHATARCTIVHFRDGSQLASAFEANDSTLADQEAFLGRNGCEPCCGLVDPQWNSATFIACPVCGTACVQQRSASRPDHQALRHRLQRDCVSNRNWDCRNCDLEGWLAPFSCGAAVVCSRGFVGRLAPLSVLLQFSGEAMLVRQQSFGVLIGAFHVG